MPNAWIFVEDRQSSALSLYVSKVTANWPRDLNEQRAEGRAKVENIAAREPFHGNQRIGSSYDEMKNCVCCDFRC
jgi:hypothetical protein